MEPSRPGSRSPSPDPASRPELFPTEQAQESERARLFDLIEEMVKWGNTTNEEVLQTPYRHGSKEQAEAFFLDGMTQAMRRLAEQTHSAFATTIYYAFKQAEIRGDAARQAPGWETFLDAVMLAGFSVSGTWPIPMERSARSIGIGANALASSIVLICRARLPAAPIAYPPRLHRRAQGEIPPALAHLQRGNIAPVDLAQAAIGPGMAVFTRYARVLDAIGNRVSEGKRWLSSTRPWTRFSPSRRAIRCRQPLGAGVVRAARLRGRRLWRRRDRQLLRPQQPHPSRRRSIGTPPETTVSRPGRRSTTCSALLISPLVRSHCLIEIQQSTWSSHQTAKAISAY